MAKKDVMIKDAPLVEVINGAEKIPVSDGSNEPRAVNLQQIKFFVGADTPLSKGQGENSVKQTPPSPTFEKKNELLTDEKGEFIEADALGDYAVALGGTAAAIGKRSVAQGHRCVAEGETSHVEGNCAVVKYIDETLNGYGSHAEGYSTVVAGTYAHAEGNKTKVVAPNAHAEGFETTVGTKGESAHAEGVGTTADAPASHAEGNNTNTIGAYSHAEGRQTMTLGEGAHAEGFESHSLGDYSHAEGFGCTSTGNASHSEGMKCNAKGGRSHAEGKESVSEGNSSHAEGWISNAIGESSHAEGQNTKTYGIASHSEGLNSEAHGPCSHAEGLGTKTNENIMCQHVEGFYNNVTDSLKIIGCGTSDEDRKNAVEVTQDGRVFVKGIGNYDGTSLEAVDLKTALDHKANSGDVYNKAEMNNIIDIELVKKKQVATINGQSITKGGNIVIEGGEGSYDDTEIREELSKKLEGEVVGTTTPTEGSIGGSYDDTEIRQEIAELSAQTKGNLLPYTTIAWQYGNRYEEHSTGSSSYAPNDRMSTKPTYFIPVSKGITYLVYGASDIFKFACKFTIDKATTTKDSGWISSEYEYTPNEDGYFQMVLARQDNGGIDMNVLLENLPQIVVCEKGIPIENIHFSADIISKQMVLDKTKTNQGSVKADSGEIVASTGADRAGYLDKIDVKGYEYIDLDGSIFDYYDVAVVTFNKNLVKKDYGWGGKRRIALMPYSEYAILNFREKNNATINGYCLLYNNELSIGLGESAEPKNEPKKRNHIYKKNKLTHLAHRGLAASLPENSIASFVAAAEAGFDGIETDCQESADGTLYCMHDLTIDRTTNGTGTLRGLSDAYLSGITLKDSQEPIPTTRDYIKVCKKYGMIPVIELKDGGISDDGIANLLSLLEQYGMKDTCVIISFSYKLLSIVRRLTEDVYVEPLLTPSLGNLLIASAFGNSGIDHDCTSTKLTEEHVLAAHKMGLNVNSYTIANAEQAEKMLNLGVDAITSHQFQGVN